MLLCALWMSFCRSFTCKPKAKIILTKRSKIISIQNVFKIILPRKVNIIQLLNMIYVIKVIQIANSALGASHFTPRTKSSRHIKRLYETQNLCFQQLFFLRWFFRQAGLTESLDESECSGGPPRGQAYPTVHGIKLLGQAHYVLQENSQTVHSIEIELFSIFNF
jgi:hypothetical protein